MKGLEKTKLLCSVDTEKNCYFCLCLYLGVISVIYFQRAIYSHNIVSFGCRVINSFSPILDDVRCYFNNYQYHMVKWHTCIDLIKQ